MANKYRIEKDLLGEKKVPFAAYYGVQTLRAKDNFHITNVPISHFSNLIIALGMVKKAAAIANHEVGILNEKRAQAIRKACDAIIEGQYHDQFVVDLIQGGAGTSTNMNANEVIANIGLELLGYEKGDYQHLHPNNHVNLSQSTNDAYQTTMRLAILLSQFELTESMAKLNKIIRAKAKEFSDVIKMGRTQLQDAVPMTLGQEFYAFANTLAEDKDRLHEVMNLMLELNLGGTAIGTGINAHPDYSKAVIIALAKISKFDFKIAEDLIEATSDTGSYIMISGIMRRIAVKLSKVCNDLRLLSSGPRAGFGEINLPPMQPGSSIMPGKVNPVIPEAVNQVAYHVIGNDLTVTMAAEGGQLQLNVFEPVILFKILESMRMLSSSQDMLGKLCIKGITANKEHCRYLVENSIGLITALNPYIGYENSTRIAKMALAQNKSIKTLILEEKLMSEEELTAVLTPENMT